MEINEASARLRALEEDLYRLVLAVRALRWDMLDERPSTVVELDE